MRDFMIRRVFRGFLIDKQTMLSHCYAILYCAYTGEWLCVFEFVLVMLLFKKALL